MPTKSGHTPPAASRPPALRTHSGPTLKRCWPATAVVGLSRASLRPHQHPTIHHSSIADLSYQRALEPLAAHPCRADTVAMPASRDVERHHWVNTYLGILDAAYRLSDEEQLYCSSMIVQLLDLLDIPGRGTPETLPAALSLEVEGGFYTITLFGPRDSGVRRPVRAADGADIAVSVEAWCQMLVQMLLSAYPELSPPDRMIAAKVFTDILTGIGVPNRAAAAFPEGLVRAYRETDEVI